MSDFFPVNQENFETEVTKSQLPILVEFGATWCGPCKMLEPALKQYVQGLNGKVRLGKIDVDESADLTQRFSVMGVPTVILFKGGKAVERISGYLPKDRLAGKFNPHL